MSAIAGYTGGGGGLARPNAQAGAAPTTATSFDGKVSGWGDLPAASQAYDDGSGTLLTSAVDIGYGYARKINGVPHQMMVGFRAYLDRVIVVAAARPLTQQASGTLKPSGPWAHHEGFVHRPATPPVRTRGSVPPGVATDTSSGGDQAKPPAAHREAASTYRYLPAPVRSTATKAVPNPTVWLGEIIQTSSPSGLPSRHRVAMLRMDDHRAVVIHAERGTQGVGIPAEQLEATNWEVTQLTYELPATTAGVPDPASVTSWGRCERDRARHQSLRAPQRCHRRLHGGHQEGLPCARAPLAP